MKYLTDAKKEEITGALSVDNLSETTCAGIDAAIDLYLSGIRHIENLPKNKNAEEAEIRKVQRKAATAIKAIDDLETTINNASSLITHRSKIRDLGGNLKRMTSELTEWIDFEDEVMLRNIGNRPKIFRQKFFEHLAILFEKTTGEDASIFTSDKPEGKFFNFVMACGGDLPGFEAVDESISRSIVESLRK
jgi:hypothetical protein